MRACVCWHKDPVVCHHDHPNKPLMCSTSLSQSHILAVILLTNPRKVNRQPQEAPQIYLERVCEAWRALQTYILQLSPPNVKHGWNQLRFFSLFFSLPGESQSITIINILAKVTLIVFISVFGLGCPPGRFRSVVFGFTYPAGENAPESHYVILQFPHLSELQYIFFECRCSRSRPGSHSSRFLWLLVCCAAEVWNEQGRWWVGGGAAGCAS